MKATTATLLFLLLACTAVLAVLWEIGLAALGVLTLGKKFQGPS